MSVLFVANWKMNMLRADAAKFVQSFAEKYRASDKVQAWIAPPITAISEVIDSTKNIPGILIGAQNVHWENSGAHTGEISVEMLKDIGAKFAIIGHSERRQFYGETNKTVSLRAKAALTKGFFAIVCVGESKEEFSAGKSLSVVQKQISESLENINQDLIQNLILAYEPVWAIGTGLAATPEQAGLMHTKIREQLIEIYGEPGKSIKLLYGGSTKPENIAELLKQADINGALVGGASLQPDTFYSMINCVS